jgi:hypothetical protein
MSRALADHFYGVRRRGAAALREQTGGVNTSPINAPWLAFTPPVCSRRSAASRPAPDALPSESAYIRVICG